MKKILFFLFCLVIVGFWRPAPAHAACTTPTGVAGDMYYNQNWRILQYCNGSFWVSAGKKLYNPTAVTFDGTNDYLTVSSSLSTIGDSNVLSGSFWFRRGGGLGTAQTVFRANTTAVVSAANLRTLIEFSAANKLHIQARTQTGPATLLDVTTGTTFADANWHHVMFAFDVNDNTKRFIYVDGAADTPTWTTYTAGNIDFLITTPRNSIGGDSSGGSKYNGDLADFWLYEGAYIDLSQAANSTKFINGTVPVYLGANGQLPIDAQDTVMLSGPLASWQTNDAQCSGCVNFAVNGALTASAHPVVEAGYFGGGGAANVTAGLVGWWRFEEGSGTSAADATGNGNTGTLIFGPTWTTGPDGSGALNLDGTNDYVNTGAGNESHFDVDRGNTFSYTAWIYRNALGHDDEIVDKVSAGAGPSFYVNNANDRLSIILIPNSGTAVGVDSNPTISAGVWHHVAATYDGSSLSTGFALYVDGSPVTMILQGGPMTGNMLNNNPLTIGIDNTACGTCYFNGKIDDVRVYNRVLSAAEVAKIYQYSGGCSTPAGAQGDIYFNTSTNTLQYCEGRNWRNAGPAGAGGGGCSTPTGVKGTLYYNTSFSYMQWCDGTKWIPLGGTVPVAPSSGLVGWWKLDESSGNAADSSGNGNTAVIAGNPVWQPTGGQLKGALAMDGVGDDAESPGLGLTATSSTSFTIAWWLKTSDGNADDVLGWSPYRYCELAVPGAGLLSCTVNSDPWASGLTTVITINNNAWHHIAWTLANGTAESLYVDGKLASSATEAITTLSPTDGIYIGGRSSGGYVSGVFDDVRVYNRALTPGEISQLYYATGGQ